MRGGGRLRRSRWHVQQISELATAAASETSMKMLNDVDGKRKLKNENENEHLENGSNKVLDSISGNVLYSVHWANGFCYSINICQEPKGVACYLPKPSTPCQHHLPHLHAPLWCANNLLRSYGCLVRPLRCQWRRFIALSFAIDNTQANTLTHTHTQNKSDPTKHGKGEGCLTQKLVQKFMISDKSTFPPVIYSARALQHSSTPPTVCRVCSLSFFSLSVHALSLPL